jgi:hypothetical protein
MDSDDITIVEPSNSSNTASLSFTEGPSIKRAKLEIGMQTLIDQLKGAKRAEEICIRFDYFNKN